ncbi:MAG TPA: hypothetical protein VFA09_25870 [Ktedonobacteraceae bacterium]|nr:hypothetical protein [Ktedonobacteraceae bacterium]
MLEIHWVAEQVFEEGEQQPDNPADMTRLDSWLKAPAHPEGPARAKNRVEIPGRIALFLAELRIGRAGRAGPLSLLVNIQYSAARSRVAMMTDRLVWLVDSQSLIAVATAGIVRGA